MKGQEREHPVLQAGDGAHQATHVHQKKQESARGASGSVKQA